MTWRIVWIVILVLACFPVAPAAMAQDSAPLKKPVLVRLADVQSASTNTSCVNFGRLQPWAAVVQKAFRILLPAIGNWATCVNADSAPYFGQMLGGRDNQILNPSVENQVESLVGGYNLSLTRVSYSINPTITITRLTELMDRQMPNEVKAWEVVGVWYGGDSAPVQAANTNDGLPPPTTGEAELMKRSDGLNKAMQEDTSRKNVILTADRILYTIPDLKFVGAPLGLICPRMFSFPATYRRSFTSPTLVGSAVGFTTWSEVIFSDAMQSSCNGLRFYKYVKTSELWVDLSPATQERAQELANAKPQYEQGIAFQNTTDQDQTWIEGVTIFVFTIGTALFISITAPGAMTGQMANFLMIVEPAPVPQAAGSPTHVGQGGETP